jgi:glycine/D-amino acid oxidase-like deaminating enzyme
MPTPRRANLVAGAGIFKFCVAPDPVLTLKGRRGARVVDLITAGDRVTGVRVADGTQYEADIVVNCVGRWTNEATRDAGLHLPLAPTVGFLVFSPPA